MKAPIRFFLYATVLLPLLCQTSVLSEEKQQVLKVPAMSKLFIDPETESEIAFSAADTQNKKELEYTIFNYQNEAAGQGKLVWNEDKKIFSTKVSLKRGFYEMAVSENGQRYGIVAVAPFTGSRDIFFGIETLYQNRPERMEEGLKILSRSGISTLREYDAWQNDEKIEGKRNTGKDAVYQEAAKLNIQSIYFFGATPEWTGSNNKKDSLEFQPYPKDLFKLERPIVEMNKARAASLAAFQVWNEPDSASKFLPGDAVMPLLEASSYFFAKNKIKIPIASPAFASWQTSPPIMNPYFKSSFLDYIDIFCYHSYHEPEKILELTKIYRSYMKASPKAGMPIWITECGKPWNRGLKNLKSTYGGERGKLRALPDEDRTSALWITMKGIEAKACGIERYFPFTMHFFEENNNNFGMMDFNGTPMRSMAAYINSIAELSNKHYSGDLNPLPSGIKLARVFSGKDSVLAVFYTGKTEPVKTSLANLPVLKSLSIDGSILKTDSEGMLEITGGLAYIYLDPPGMEGRIQVDTEPMKLLRLAESYKPVPRKASPLVFQFPSWNLKIKNQYTYTTNSNLVEVNVYNISDEEQKLTPELICPDKITIKSVNFPSEPIRIPAKSMQTLKWELNDQSALVSRNFTVRAKEGNAGDLYLPFISYADTETKSLRLNQVDAWRQNSSGEMTISYDETEKALRFHVDFSKAKNGYWCYPEYVLQAADESLQNAVAISFEVKMKQKNDTKYVPHQLVMLVDQNVKEKGKYDSLAYHKPDNEWHEEFLNISFPDSEKYKMIRIGMGASENELDFWLRNIKIHYKK